MTRVSSISEISSVSLKKKVDEDVKRKNIKAIATAAGVTLGVTGAVLLGAHCFKKGKFPTLTTPVKNLYENSMQVARTIYTNNKQVKFIFDKFVSPIHQTFKELPKYIKIFLNVVSQVMTIKAIYDIFKNNQLKQKTNDLIDRWHPASATSEQVAKN